MPGTSDLRQCPCLVAQQHRAAVGCSVRWWGAIALSAEGSAAALSCARASSNGRRQIEAADRVGEVADVLAPPIRQVARHGRSLRCTLRLRLAPRSRWRGLGERIDSGTSLKLSRTAREPGLAQQHPRTRRADLLRAAARLMAAPDDAPELRGRRDRRGPLPCVSSGSHLGIARLPRTTGGRLVSARAVCPLDARSERRNASGFPGSPRRRFIR
jgi:hypothetical protein